jgi:hypothetical protein
MFFPMLNVVVMYPASGITQVIWFQLQALPKQLEMLLKLYVKTSGQYGMFQAVLSFESHSTCSNAYFHV